MYRKTLPSATPISIGVLFPSGEPWSNEGMTSYERRRQNLRRLLVTRFENRSVDLAKALNISPSYLSRLFTRNADHLRNVGEQSAREYERALGLDAGWLDEEHGPYTRPAAAYTLSAAEEVVASHAWIYAHLGSAKPDQVQAITADGDAMAPTIAQGDILFLDRSVKKVTADGVYVISLTGQTFVRRVQRGMDGTLHLLCDNARYPAHQVQPGSNGDFDVVGKIIGVWRWQSL
jgi:SOS-response transcriptional repressor LexA